MAAALAQGQPHALRSLAEPAYLTNADPGPTGGGTYTSTNTDYMMQQYENIFGPAARDIKLDPQRHKRHQRWHLPDALKGSNQYLTDRIDGLITDATNSPFTRNILPYAYLEHPDQKLTWNVYSFDEGIASRVPYEAAARVLPQSKRSFAGYVVRQGLAILMEHNFMMSENGRQNFQNQLNQLVGSIQLTNDLDVHMALLGAPSYQKTQDEKYMDNSLTTAKVCRQYIDLFGMMQKNENALDYLIEDAKQHLKTWGSQPPTFMLCNGALTRQMTMNPEKTNYVTQGIDGKKRLAQGPDLPSYRGLSIINTRKFSMESGQIPRDLLRRRVRVSEYYIAPWYMGNTSCEQSQVQTNTNSMLPLYITPPDDTTPSICIYRYEPPNRAAYPDRYYEFYDQSRDTMFRLHHEELARRSLLGTSDTKKFIECLMHMIPDEKRKTPGFGTYGDIYNNNMHDCNDTATVPCVWLDACKKKHSSSIVWLDIWGELSNSHFNHTDVIKYSCYCVLACLICLDIGTRDYIREYLENKDLIWRRFIDEFLPDAEPRAQEVNANPSLYMQGRDKIIRLIDAAERYKENNTLTDLCFVIEQYKKCQVFAQSQKVHTSFAQNNVQQIHQEFNVMHEEFLKAKRKLANSEDANVYTVLQSITDDTSKYPLIKKMQQSVALECDLVMLRPNIEHEMLGIIMGRGGTGELGCTFWGQTELSCYDDAQHGLWGMSYKYHEKALVTNERNLIRLFDVAFDGYNGGMDDRYVIWDNVDSRNEFTTKTHERNIPYNGPSMLVMHMPAHRTRVWPNPVIFDDHPNETITPPVGCPDTGKRCIDINMHRLSQMSHGGAEMHAIFKLYMNLLGMSNWNELLQADQLPGTACVADETALSLFSFSGQLTIYDQNMNIMEQRQGAGHLGPSYVGVASVREGRGISVQPGRPTTHRLV